MRRETLDEYYLAEMSKGVGIFPPSGIVAIATVGGCVGDRDKVKDMLRQVNEHEELLTALKDMCIAFGNSIAHPAMTETAADMMARACELLKRYRD